MQSDPVESELLELELPKLDWVESKVLESKLEEVTVLELDIVTEVFLVWRLRRPNRIIPQTSSATRMFCEIFAVRVMRSYDRSYGSSDG